MEGTHTTKKARSGDRAF